MGGVGLWDCFWAPSNSHWSVRWWCRGTEHIRGYWKNWAIEMGDTEGGGGVDRRLCIKKVWMGLLRLSVSQ